MLYVAISIIIYKYLYVKLLLNDSREQFYLFCYHLIGNQCLASIDYGHRDHTRAHSSASFRSLTNRLVRQRLPFIWSSVSPLQGAYSGQRRTTKSNADSLHSSVPSSASLRKPYEGFDPLGLPYFVVLRTFER